MATTPRKAALVSPMPSPERRQRAWAAFTSAGSATAMTAAASVGTGTPAARLPSKGFSINGSSDAIPAPTTLAAKIPLKKVLLIILPSIYNENRIFEIATE